MSVPFMRAYTELLVQTCHRRDAHAIGGMAAFIPSRRDAEVNATAFAKVREDKGREADAGYDGAWVAHPDLVPVVAGGLRPSARGAPHQKERRREEVRVDRDASCSTSGSRRPGSPRPGLRATLPSPCSTSRPGSAAPGAVAINNLMEDTATAEIARAQLWQWIRHAVRTEDGDGRHAGAGTRAAGGGTAPAGVDRGAGARLADAAAAARRAGVRPRSSRSS